MHERILSALVAVILVCHCALATEWKGLERASFSGAEEARRARALLERFDDHCTQFPSQPGPTPLFCLLKGDPQSIALANRMIVEGKGNHAHGHEPLWILMLFADQLTPAARAKLDEWVLENLKPTGFQWTRATGFRNVNWPLSAAAILIIGGQVEHDPAAVKQGTAKLQAILDGLVNAPIGTVSEFNSPPYYAADITALSGLARFADCEETRIKAMILEERLWLDMAARYSTTLARVAGPYSGVYFDGYVGCMSGVGFHLAKVFDGNVINDFRQLMVCGQYAGLEWIPVVALQTAHCPDYLREIALEKSIPYEVRGTSAGEQFYCYPAAHLDLHTEIGQTWALGTTSRHWLDGHQQPACVAHWAKRLPVRGMRDFKTMISAYQVNDCGPDPTFVFQPIEVGRLNSVQNGNSALVLYKPKIAAGRALMASRLKPLAEPKIKSLRLDLQVPLYEDIDEIAVGYRSIDPKNPDVAIAVSWWNEIYLRDGNVYIGIRPLEPTNLGAERPLRIRQYNECLLISIYNLDVTEGKVISDQVLNRCKNGFVIEMGDTSHYPTLDDFRRHSGRVTEDTLSDDGVRSVLYSYGSHSLGIKYNMDTEAFIERKVDRCPVTYPLFDCPDALITNEPPKDGLKVGDGRLLTDPGTYSWLISNPSRTTYAGYNFTDTIVPLALRTPDGTVQAAAIGFGKIVVRNKPAPGVEIWAAKRDGPITLSKAFAAKVMLNGKNVTAQLRQIELDGRVMMQLP